MKNKKNFGTIAVLAIATLTAFNVSINTDEKGLSDISLDNMKALANENGTSEDCSNTYKGKYCGIFLPAGATNGIKFYYEK